MKKISNNRFLKPSHKQGSFASYPALQIVQNDQKFFFFTIPAEDIFPYCFVTRRTEDAIEGFQRNLGEDRALSIATYLDDSDGSIPTNIVLSAQEEAQLQYVSKTKSIRFKRIPKAFLVIDGQHRLYGYGLTRKKHRVPVSTYVNLNRKEEAALFIDINTTQRGVPASLLLDIKHLAEKESEKEEFLRKLFDSLNSDPDSPLNGLLSPADNKRGKINRVAFNRSFSDLDQNSIFTQLSAEKQAELLKNFFISIEENLRNPALLSRSVYFESITAIFDETIRTAYTKHRNYKLASLRDVLSPLKVIDLESIVTRGKSRLTKNDLVPLLKASISSSMDISDDLV
jgi:DGQHR domain-containing protein